MLTMYPIEYFVQKGNFTVLFLFLGQTFTFFPLNKQVIEYIFYRNLKNHKMYVIKEMFSSPYFYPLALDCL